MEGAAKRRHLGFWDTSDGVGVFFIYFAYNLQRFLLFLSISFAFSPGNDTLFLPHTYPLACVLYFCLKTMSSNPSSVLLPSIPAACEKDVSGYPFLRVPLKSTQYLQSARIKVIL